MSQAMSEDMSVRDAFRVGRRPESPGKAVLDKFGNGKVKAHQKEDLRSSLLNELQAKGLAEENPAAVYEEVDKFVQNGHISGSNLSRLERRVERRVFAFSARGSSRTATADLDFSVGSQSVCSRPLSSRDDRPRSNTPGSARISVSSRGLMVGGQQAVSHASRPSTCAEPKWSEIAGHAKLLEQKERLESRSKIRERQQKMREELEQQMVQKEKQKLVVEEERKIIFERQKVELQAWHEAEHLVVEEQKRIALEVRKEREIQNAVVSALKNAERHKKLHEDDALVQRAADEIDQEKKIVLAKKEKQREVMSKLMADWSEDRNHREDEKRKQAMFEKAKVSEFQAMLDAQEAQNKRRIPPPRNPMGEYSPPDKAERRKKERAFEDEMLKLVQVANAKATEAEMQKKEKKDLERQTNQDFLFNQISERNASKLTKLDENKKQKEAILAAAAEFTESEKQKHEKQKLKNIQHRIELEQQIERRKPPTRFQRRHAEDSMSAAEVAMNRHLLEEARTLRDTLESKVHSGMSTTF